MKQKYKIGGMFEYKQTDIIIVITHILYGRSTIYELSRIGRDDLAMRMYGYFREEELGKLKYIEL